MRKRKNTRQGKHVLRQIKQEKAVAEVIGEFLMLAMIVSIIGFLYFNVSSIPEPSVTKNVTILGTVEDNNLVLQHQKGESLNLDTAVTLNMIINNETFLVKNYLDAKALLDGEWNIGEKVIYPFPFNLSNIQNYFTASLHVADKESNSLVFIGGFDVYPETDLGVTITADNLAPAIGDQVNFTICVTNSKGAPAKDIEILCVLSRNFSYFSNISSRGFYNSDTGIWNVSYLEVGESACLTLTAIVTLSSEPTQLAMVLDGSGSISSSDWNIMREGLARSIENSSVFPHDGNVELTVVQFGQRLAQRELGPVIVTKSNYLSIGAQIRSISQLGGYTPISCGIRLAADLLRNNGNFAPSKRQIINLVTDGVANCYWTTGYSSTYQGYDGWGEGEDRYHTGNSSAKASSNRRGDITSNDVDTSGATSITVDFWYRLDDTESDDLYLYYYDGSSYDYITALGGGAEDTWLHYTQTITHPQYFKLDFKIRLRSQPEIGENVWIDDVRIRTNTQELFNDSFEGEYWAEHWWNPGLKSAEDASVYLQQTLQMTSSRDEFDALAVGVGGMYGGPDVDWLKKKVVWPQPGHFAPPYIAGWVRSITSWQEFEETIREVFSGYFGISNQNLVKILTVTPSTDPHPENNEVSIVLDTGG